MQLTPIKTKRFGINFLIKNSDVEVQIFPALLKFKQVDSNEEFNLAISIKGPVKNFVVDYPLQKDYLRISMQTTEGFLAYRLMAENNQVMIFLEKSFSKDMLINQQIIKEKEKKSVFICSSCLNSIQPMLFLGSMKKKDSALVLEEGDLKTILPWFFYLSQSVPKSENSLNIKDEILKKFLNKKSSLSSFSVLFKSVFQGFFCPRDEDFSNQGTESFFEKNVSNLAKINFFKNTLIKLFIELDDNKIIFLHNLPKNFHQGSLINFSLQDLIISFSWSCGKIQKVKIQSFKNKNIKLVFPKEIKSFKILGGAIMELENHEVDLSVFENKVLILENFLK